MNKTEQIKTKFAGLASEWKEINPKRVYFNIPPGKIRDVMRFLVEELGLRFIIASGTDTREAFEIIYHFSDDNTGTVYSARALLADKKDPRIDSIADLFIGAMWIEREIHELLGVTFNGNEDLRHLLLSDDWPKGNFPLRHDNDR
jgi:NADH-quinone oxidoreductase subunit C